jgi:glycine/D-amino acid oxidase-like deaminating enzyme/nitrite reductase/ring-hydroxylating ferredoxin subunit
MNQAILSHEGESKSPWMNDFEMHRFMPLHRDIDTEVCIIGGGIAGLTTAYLLIKEGKKVCVLEDHEIGSGQSGKSTAHFTVALDTPYLELEKIHGTDGIKLIAQSHQAAIQVVKEIVFKESFSCDLEMLDGNLFTTGKLMNGIEKELQAMHRAGIDGAYLEEKSPLPFHAGPSLRIPNQVQLHPLKYLKGLAEVIQRRGGKIFTHTHAKQIHGGGKAHVITTDGYKIECKSIVVATNTPINNWFSIHNKQTANRTYAVSALIPSGSVSKALYWDTLEKNHYIRIQTVDQDHDLLIIGGEGHRTGQDDEPIQNYIKLETWARDHFPFIQSFLQRWSGQVFESIDGIGHLGQNPLDQKNVFIISGDNGNGMTNGTIGAMIITDEIMTRTNPWSDLYNPSRFKLKTIREFIKENLKTASQYADWIKEKDFEELEDIPQCQGTVIRKGMKMIAAYKDENGNIDLHSAICPHLGGIVQWNSSEKSWDCPCHGSRFDAHGAVIEGPANRNLKSIRKSSLIPTPFTKKPQKQEQPHTPGAKQ